MGGVISLYKPTTTLQPKVLGFAWCTLSHGLFPDNPPEKYYLRGRMDKQMKTTDSEDLERLEFS